MGKIAAFEEALSSLITVVDDNVVDVTFVNCNGLDAEVTFSKDDILLDYLVGKKIFKIQDSMIRMYSENDTSGTIDLYTGIESLADLDNIDKVETRIGNIESFRDDFVKDVGDKESYPARGFYSRGIYISNGVLQNGRVANDLKIRIDLVKPENTFF
jgi:hypothetical protein